MTSWPWKRSDYRGIIERALSSLGKKRLVLGVHDSCFPDVAGEDLGRGSPYGAGGVGFIRFAHALGFSGIQFGPQGQTSRANPSPYDGALFSKNVLSIALGTLADDPRWNGLVPRAEVSRLAAGRPTAEGDPKRAHDYAFDAGRAALRFAFERLGDRAPPERTRALAAFRAAEAWWLDGDALYGACARENGTEDWTRFQANPLDKRLFAPRPGEQAACARRLAELAAGAGDLLAFHAFCQFILHEQHADLRAVSTELGLKLYGDLQVGCAHSDRWRLQSLYLTDYRLGAPPSRTTPAGQPWGFPVFDPAQYRAPDGGPGPVFRLMAARIDRLLGDFDGVRIDHPHGLVCPWVYDANAPDSLKAVQDGARLFASPELWDHPALARFALVTQEQLNTKVARYADDWVQRLDSAQLDAYGGLLDLVLLRVDAQGRARGDVHCEVLSTWPYPLRRVMERRGLGRMRVTQKASLDNPADVYRGENAEAHDWIMVGNHDTQPIWRLADAWHGSSLNERRADYYAERLIPVAGERAAFSAALCARPAAMVEAAFADLFASPAENVSIFFPDLLGLKEVYNTPGTVNDHNWLLRVPADYEAAYGADSARGAALHLPRALARALRARHSSDAALLAALDRLHSTPGPD